jgi:hypothetical protein
MNLIDKFKCECGNTSLKEVHEGCLVTNYIFSLEEGGEVDYVDEEIKYSEEPWFECSECGFRPEDEDGDYINSLTQLVQWLQFHFGDRETEAFSPRYSSDLKTGRKGKSKFRQGPKGAA